MKIKHIIYLFVLFFLASCMEWDNYEEPQETLQGKIVEQGTGEPFQTQIGADGVQLKLLEYSWSDNPEPYYFSVKQDGTFRNTKLFKGTYQIIPYGAFVPLVVVNEDGDTIKDESVTTEISEVTELTFEVDPFLKLEWAGEPQVSADGESISVDVKITRGTQDTLYHQNVDDIYLFVNASSPYVGDNNFTRSISTRIRGDAANDALGSVITMETSAPLDGGRTYYLRVGARTSFTGFTGVRRYNYNEPISVDVP